jgi:lipopolysaccharide transport system permease protein
MQWISNVRRHRELAYEMAMFDLRSRNQGSILGLAWLVIRPLFQATVYILFIRVFFSGAATTHWSDQALYVLSGLLVWDFSSKYLTDAPVMLTSRMQLVTQTPFPLEIVPLTRLAVAGVGAMILLALVIALGGAFGKLSWTIFLLPVALALVVGAAFSAALLLMLAGVVLKDLSEIVTIVFSTLIFVSPVILSPASVPEWLWNVVLLNPLSHAVIVVRGTLFGDLPLTSWVVLVALNCVLAPLATTLTSHVRLRINEYL